MGQHSHASRFPRSFMVIFCSYAHLQQVSDSHDREKLQRPCGEIMNLPNLSSAGAVRQVRTSVAPLGETICKMLQTFGVSAPFLLFFFIDITVSSKHTVT